MSLPDALPTLSAGAHEAESGEACVMEYVALLAGEDWTDRPECTHPVLAHEARTANDLMADADRPRLVPLVGRLFGTTEDSPALRAALRRTQAERVARLLPRDARAVVDATLAATGDPSEAIDLCRTFPVRSGDLDPDHVAVHVGSSRVMAFVAGPDLEPVEAWALAALTVAHRVAAGECRADCGDPAARGRLLAQDLAALVDTYDAFTGRTAGIVTSADVRELGEALVG